MTDKTALEYYVEAVEIRQDPAKFNADGMLELRQKLEQAVARSIETGENSSLAHAELAYTYVRFYQQGWTRPDWPANPLEMAEELAQEALNRKDDFDSRWSLAIVYWNQGKFSESFAEYEKAAHHWDNRNYDQRIEEYETLRGKDSRNPDLMADMAEARIYAGEPYMAIQQLNDAIAIRGKMDGEFAEVPYWYWWNLARAYYMAGRYREALAAAAEIRNPPNDVLLVIAASKAQHANDEMRRFSENDPEWSISKAGERNFHRPEDRQHWLDGLRRAGLKEQ